MEMSVGNVTGTYASYQSKPVEKPRLLKTMA